MLNIPNNVKWFAGVVENRDDPEMQGRIQVRVFGLHPFSRVQGDITGIPVEDLPWMTVVMPSTSASLFGMGGAITGLMPGSHVFGLWLDKWYQNGIVLGSTTGHYAEQPNFEEGFSDPNGSYPIDGATTDTNAINVGGEAGQNSDINKDQNNNRATGANPDGSNQSQGAPDDGGGYTLDKLLEYEEGNKLKLYWDKKGYPTIGRGHLVIREKITNTVTLAALLTKQVGRPFSPSHLVITEAESMKLYIADRDKNLSIMLKSANVKAAYAKLNYPRQCILISMAFQMGGGAPAKFKTMLKHIMNDDYVAASNAMLKSKWYEDTVHRCRRHSNVMKTGNFGIYGYKGKSIAKPPTGTKVFIGDSIANGYGNASKGSTVVAKVGANPQTVLGFVKQTVPDNNIMKGKEVIISTGMSNNFNQTNFISNQLEHLQKMGVKAKVIGASFTYPKTDPVKLNQWLKDQSNKYGHTFLGGFEASGDNVHPKSYANLPNGGAASKGNRARMASAMSTNSFMPEPDKEIKIDFSKYVDFDFSKFKDKLKYSLDYIQEKTGYAKEKIAYMLANGYAIDGIVEGKPLPDEVGGDDYDPSEPIEPDDSPILFKEPATPYAGKYPYIQANTTEGGILQEVDNTPDAVRIRNRHPTGSYNETHPDGTYVNKTVNTRYTITDGAENTYVGNSKNVNVFGKETYYNVGDYLNQVDGNYNRTIQGNQTQTIYSNNTTNVNGNSNLNVLGNNEINVQADEIKTITGNGTINVGGNITIIVDGNANITVSGNAETNISGNHNIKVGGDLNYEVSGSITQKAGGSLKQDASSVTTKASGAVTIDGSIINLG